MPHLSADYVYRFFRLNSLCRDEFASRVEPGESSNLMPFGDEREAWRHADLFLAGFPRVGVRAGHDMLCWFTLNDSDRGSCLWGYVKDGPEMVPDEFDRRLFMQRLLDAEVELPYDLAIEDEQVLLVPRMPSGWMSKETRDPPSWLRLNPNVVLTDDGTPEGVFERAQLLLWSDEPVSRWHAVGYGHHRIQVFPPTLGEAFRHVDEEGQIIDGTAPGNQGRLPDVWLPRVETGLSCNDLDWAPLPAEEVATFKGKTCTVVRFYTYCEHGVRAYYEVTVWITDDVWHSVFSPILMGEGGFIC